MKQNENVNLKEQHYRVYKVYKGAQNNSNLFVKNKNTNLKYTTQSSRNHAIVRYI